MTIVSKPNEKLLMETATASGCTDANALAQALEAAANNGGHFVDSLLDAEVLPDEAAFFQNLGASLRLPFAAAPQLDPKTPPHTQLPARLALRHRVLPLRSDGAGLQLLTYNPFDLEARQMAGQALDENVTWVLATRTVILEALRAGYGVGAG